MWEVPLPAPNRNRTPQWLLFAAPVFVVSCTPSRDEFAARPTEGASAGGARVSGSDAGALGAGGTPGAGGTVGAGGTARQRDAGSDAASPDAGRPTTPIIPIGYDAYRAWDRLSQVRIGARTYMRSTYDRSGENEGADASHFIRQEADDRNVTLDVEGNGVLEFVRTNHWHGSPWHYGIDGTDVLVQESSTADPVHPVPNSVFLPENAFPNPLTWTWSVTKGADLNWVPMPFEKRLTLAYGRTHYGTGYYIYELFPDGADNLSAPLSAFTAAPPPADVIALLSSAGDDLSPKDQTASEVHGTLDIPAGASARIASIDGARTIRAIAITASDFEATALSRARLRITWDDRAEPSVDAPLALFFGAGSLENRNAREWLVKGLLANVRFHSGEITLAAYFPMPFFSHAKVELVAGSTVLTGVTYSVKTVPNTDSPETTGYFHATYRDHGEPTAGQDLVILDTTNAEGGGDWCGTFTGMSFIFSDRAVLDTLEGDPRFFFDDSGSPQAQGTGTEEWAGGGDYWGGQNMTLPLAGHPVGAPSVAASAGPEDQIESAYRFLVADSMPFGKNARIQLEHGGDDLSLEHYRSVAYWYGVPGACLVLSDSFHVGDARDETLHGYSSPDASDVESVTSRYEFGPDHAGAFQLFPPTTDTGRHTTGTTEFSVSVLPENLGVMLRRKLDYSYANQRARVYVAADGPSPVFSLAGTWYLAGSNQCVYSNPPGETDAPVPVVETSNRRFRDDEFLVPRRLTEGRSRLRIRIVFDAKNPPLTPGGTPTQTAWSELRYWAYSWVLPGLNQ